MHPASFFFNTKVLCPGHRGPLVTGAWTSKSEMMLYSWRPILFVWQNPSANSSSLYAILHRKLRPILLRPMAYDGEAAPAEIFKNLRYLQDSDQSHVGFWFWRVLHLLLVDLGWFHSGSVGVCCLTTFLISRQAAASQPCTMLIEARDSSVSV